MELRIEPLSDAAVSAYHQHAQRHRAESGGVDGHFMPFAAEDADGPRSIELRLLTLPLSAPHWERWWVAWAPDGVRVIGHVDLKGDSLRAGLHRCELGIGIERPYRGAGLGRRLMREAIDFARGAPSLDWMDLRVFGHNAQARRLYASLGFQQLGVITDRFRIEGTSIDDVIMALDLRRS